MDNLGFYSYIGLSIEKQVANISENIANSLINGGGLVMISTCISLYLLIKGYLIMAGKSNDVLPDVMITIGKWGLILLLVFVSGNLVQHIFPFFDGLEKYFIHAISHQTSQSVWTSLDEFYLQCNDVCQQISNLASHLGKFDFASKLLVYTCYGAIWISTIVFLLATFSLFLMTKLSLVLCLGFSPVFFGLLMFPITRSWFDGWLKAIISFILTLAIALGILGIFSRFYTEQIQILGQVIYQNNQMESLLSLILPIIGNVLIMSLVSASAIRLAPSLASALTGSITLQVASLGNMATTAGRTAVSHSVATFMGSKQALRVGGEIAKAVVNPKQAAIKAGMALKHTTFGK